MSERASKQANTHPQVGENATYLIFPKRVQTSPSEHLKFSQASPNELTSGRAFDERDELTSFCPKTGALNTGVKCTCFGTKTRQLVTLVKSSSARQLVWTRLGKFEMLAWTRLDSLGKN